MSGFKDMVAVDNKAVFLNADEFAERHIVLYDNVRYPPEGTDPDGIPIILSDVKQEDRRKGRNQLVDDSVQGLYLVTAVMHCALTDLGGVVPEKGTVIAIGDIGVPSVPARYKVAAASCDAGMIRLELGAIDE